MTDRRPDVTSDDEHLHDADDDPASGQPEDPASILEDEIDAQRAIDESTGSPPERAGARDAARRDADERLGVDQRGPNPS